MKINLNLGVSLAKGLDFVESKNPYLLILFPFIVPLIAQLFLPSSPVKDEVFYYPELINFGESYPNWIESIESMTQSMGPVFFMVFGGIGKVVD